MKSFERFFLWDHEGDGFETFATEAEMLAAAGEAIKNHFDEFWSEEVEDVVCGVITHRAQKTEVRTRVMGPDGYVDQDGEEWPEDIDDECDEMCRYEMLPIHREVDELAAAREALGAGWLAGGVTLAEGIRRKTAALERMTDVGLKALGSLDFDEEVLAACDAQGGVKR